MMENSWSYSEFWAIEIVADVSNDSRKIFEFSIRIWVGYWDKTDIGLILMIRILAWCV